MIHPPIDKLLERIDSKYALVIVAAKRARQLNTYHHQLGEGNIDTFAPPMVESRSKNYLTMALEEIAQGKLHWELPERTCRSRTVRWRDAPPLVLVGVTGGVAAYKTCEVVRRLVEAGRDVRCALTPDADALHRPAVARGAHAQARARRPPGARRHLSAPRRGARRGRRLHRAVHGQHAREAGVGAGRQRRHPERALDARAAARGAGDERAHVGAPADAGQRRRACASAASRSSARRPGALAEGEQGVGRMAEPRRDRRGDRGAARAARPGRSPAGACSSPPAERASRSTACASSATARPGRMGAALAAEASARGAEVVTLLANGTVRPESGSVVEVETTEQLEREALARAEWADVVLMAAAVADYRPAQQQPGKRERSGSWSLELEPTADVLAAPRGAPPPRPGARRLRRRGRRRPRARRGQAAAQGRRPDRAQRRLAHRHRLRRRPQRGRRSSPPTAPSTCARAPKRAIAAAVLDRVERLLG